MQILGVWAELFLLLMLFFYSFDLSFAFIARKIGFLISQGVVTTLYISAISIAVATIIALVGAIAKLSKDGVVYGLASFYTSLFRGLPLLMQIYIIYLGLPQVGIVIDAVPAEVGTWPRATAARARSAHERRSASSRRSVAFIVHS